MNHFKWEGTYWYVDGVQAFIPLVFSQGVSLYVSMQSLIGLKIIIVFSRLIGHLLIPKVPAVQLSSLVAVWLELQNSSEFQVVKTNSLGIGVLF